MSADSESGQTFPEHEKLALVADRSQAIGEFLDWAELQGWHLMTVAMVDCGQCGGLRIPDDPCSRCGGKGLMPSSVHYTHAPGSVTAKLAQHFDIDLGRLEDEKRAILDEHRSRTGAVG